MKNSFRDSQSNVLKAWGFTTENQPGDLVRNEDDDFNLDPGKWKLQGAVWVPHEDAQADEVPASFFN